MKLHYKPYLKLLSRNLRKAGILSEVLLWNELKGDKLGYRFLRQRPLGVHIADFYCPILRLAVEIDGVTTHDAKIEEDAKRQQAIESFGIYVLRFKDAEVRFNLAGVIGQIKLEILRLADSPFIKGSPLKAGGICSPPPLKNEEYLGLAEIPRPSGTPFSKGEHSAPPLEEGE
jgi:very-short-patch-repair endonuclease